MTKLTKTLNVLGLVLFSATFVSFLFLVSHSSHAESSSASASVTVASACTMESILDSEHTAEIINGTYKENIGKTTLKVICNDSEGFSIYAVGYTLDEPGNTNLINQDSATVSNIVTGTATSGDTSNWAMKLTSVSGSSAPTIVNNYNAYKEVPTQNTKVATSLSATNVISGSSIEATYRAYIARGQLAGVYNGKVKYTMIHPVSAEPTSTKDCEANKICYWPNAVGVVDTMGNQSAGTTVLWASNFQRKGYGFAGWSDKYDWVLNENDENGNGIGINEGYHIYGPNQTITTPGNFNTNGLSLYAVWVKSEGYLQDWSGCNALNISEVTALTDKRNNQAYAVAKLKNGTCWMIENLRLGENTALTVEPATTNITSSFTLYPQNPQVESWCRTYNSADCINHSRFSSENTTSPTNNMTTANSNVYSYGSMYNWHTATAGTGTYSTSSGNASGDICPKGWRLPTGGSGGEYSKLDIALGGTGSTQYTAVAPQRWLTYPNNMILSGYIAGSFEGRGSNGSNWTSTATGSGYAYEMTFNSSSWLYPGTDDAQKTSGLTIRCITPGIIGPSYTITYNSNGGSGTMTSQTVAINSTVTLNLNTFTGPSGQGFVGWNTASGGTGTSYANGAPVTNLTSAGGNITLYAQWGPNIESSYANTGKQKHKGYYKMQDMTPEICNDATIIGEGSQMQAIDTRDNKIYWIAKLADGKCWMTQNLDHDIVQGRLYTSSDTDLPDGTSWTPIRSTYKTGNTIWSKDSNGNIIQQSYDPGDKIWNGIPIAGNGTTLNNMVQGNNTHYHIGNYYNFGAAVAMDSTREYITTNDPQIDQSICPKGWTLPKGGSYPLSGSYVDLLNKYNISSGSSMKVWDAPLYFPISGAWYGGSYHVASRGHFLSSTVADSQHVYDLGGNSDDSVYAGNGELNRYIGASVRCVSR